MNTFTYTIAEFCAGTGAFTLGFEKTKKFKTIFATDFDKNSKLLFDANNKNIKLTLEDIHNLNYKNIPKMNIITCGFPCQPFSIAGSQKGFEDNRSKVFWKICDIIDFHRPDVLILENVKNIISHNNKKTINIILDKIKNLNYFIKYKVLNTCKITNIPQNRERIFIIGFKNKNNYDKFEFPENNDNLYSIKKFLSTCEHEHEYIDKKYYYSNRYKIWDAVNKNVDKKYVCYQIRRNIIRMNKSNLCPTLTCNMGKGGHNVPIIKDDIGIRKLTPRECFNLQGFPNNYIFPSNLSDNKLYSLVGNSVTVPVIELLAENIHKAMQF